MANFREYQIAMMWSHLNEDVFGGALLSRPQFEFTESSLNCCRWDSASRTVFLSREFTTASSTYEFMEALKVPMVGQYVSDVLGVADEAAQGPAFQMICRRLGVDARAAGSGLSVAAKSRLEKIEKLLLLGQSDNPNEAKVALKQAKAMMIRYGLDESTRGIPADGEIGAVRVGASFNRIPASAKALSQLLMRHFRVKTGWIHDDKGKRLELVGEQGQIEFASHVHEFLTKEGQRLWSRNGNRSQRAKEEFLQGLFFQVDKSLESEVCDQSDSGLVVHQEARWAIVEEFFDARYANATTLKGSRGGQGAHFQEGREAGKNVTIRPPVKAGAGPKLLEAKSGT